MGWVLCVCDLMGWVSRVSHSATEAMTRVSRSTPCTPHHALTTHDSNRCGTCASRAADCPRAKTTSVHLPLSHARLSHTKCDMCSRHLIHSHPHAAFSPAKETRTGCVMLSHASRGPPAHYGNKYYY